MNWKIIAKNISFFVILFMLNACKNGNYIHVTPLSESSNTDKNHVVYHLPKTSIAFEAEFRKKIFLKGPYSEFAEKYLGIKNVMQIDKTEWNITSIDIKQIFEPDSAFAFLIDAKDNVYANNIQLTPDGLIQCINCKNSNFNTLENTITHYNLDSKFEQIPFTDLSVKSNFLKPNEKKNKKAKKDTSFAEIPIMKKEVLQKTTEMKAQEAAHFIHRLRKRRFKLVSGAYEKFAQQNEVKVLLEELEREEKEYLELFIGKSYEEYYNFTFYMTPDKNNITTPTLLFRFAPNKGILPLDDLRGNPILVSILKTNNTHLNSLYTEKQKNNKKRKDALNGFYYRTPELCKIQIFNAQELIASTSLLIPQLGNLQSLAPDILNDDTAIEFYPQLGAIKRIQTHTDTKQK